MGKLISRLFIFLVLALSNLCITLDGKVISKEILANVDRKLKLLNKPAVKSIQVKYLLSSEKHQQKAFYIKVLL